ncbi:MAG TPA: amidase family protein [Actinomycetota bacterium]|jgi:amidase
MSELELVALSATDLAEQVRGGKISPAELATASLHQIERLDARIGAFETVRGERALRDAEALGERDLTQLPLAGVPIAIKDNIPVAGEPARDGSRATDAKPRGDDHEIARRLREAGAVVVGISRMSELGVWGMTDNGFGTSRNPWNLERTPGGSSGGSAAAVASAMVPVAQGNDGLGSIRIPSACCGLFGIRPGRGVVPANIGKTDWFGWAENGPLATTVADAALILSVMAGRPELRNATAPDGGLRIGVALNSPVVGAAVDPEFERATKETADLLTDAGHRVSATRIPYATVLFIGGLWWWTAAVAEETEDLDFARLGRATKRHAQIGRAARRLHLVRERPLTAWRRQAARLFERFDLLLTPALLKTPPRAEGWHRRGWVANMNAQVRYAPFAAWWNLAQYPAASVPAGLHTEGLPLAVQLVGPPGSEATILSVVKLLEELRPWRRHAPIAETG